MSVPILDTLPGNEGVTLRTIEGRMKLASGVTGTKGNVYTVDLSTATTGGVCTEIKQTSGTAAVEEGDIYCVALEDGSAGDTIRVAFQGAVECLAGATAGFTAEGAVAIDTDQRVGAAGAGTHVVGVALDTAAAGSFGTVWFFGLNTTWKAA